MLKKQNTLKFLLALFLVGSWTFSLMAQQNMDAASKWERKLAELDQSKITSGILYNRVTPAAGLQNYNSEENQNVAKLIHFRQAISELYRASNKQQFISSKELLQQVDEYQKEDNEVLLGLIHTQFQMLNHSTQAPMEGGVLWDGENFELIEGQPLYLDKEALVMSPLQKAVKGTEVLFSLPQEFMFANATSGIQELTADFGDGNKHFLIKKGKKLQSKVAITYATSGEKTLQFEAKFSNGTAMKTAGMLYVIASQSGQRNVECTQGGIIEDDFVIADVPFQGYDEDYPVFGRIDYRIFYRDNATSARLNNPVIIIDGFDPEDQRRIQDCDCAEDPDCASSYTNINGEFQADGANGHRAIEDLMTYPKNDGSFGNLISELRTEGYDVIIVNHPGYTGVQTNGEEVEIDGGADYIERNALALVKLIQEVNLRITRSRHRMAIIGPSMGGQISRYALAYMEKRYAEDRESEWRHNVRLWMSIDSPHLGANIPIGIQALVDMLARADIEAAIDLRDNQIRSIAANQQLIEQHTVGGSSSNFDSDPAYMDGRTITQGFDSDHGAPFYTEFYDNLYNNGMNGSNGYPQNLRKIALANGSLTGSKAFYNPFDEVIDAYAGNGEKVINIRGFQNVCIPWPCFDVHVASLEASFLGSTGEDVEIARLKRGFIDNDTHATNHNNRGSMDNVPGGWFNSQQVVVSSVFATDAANAQNSFWNSFRSAFSNIIEFISDAIGETEWQLREDDFSPVHAFIPTFSALGHLDPNQSWAQALTNNLVCEENTPFDSYYGEALNSSHTSFNEASVNWLMAELAGDEQEPFFPVDPDKLVGPGTVCLGTNYTYTFAPCSTPGDVATWELSDNLSLVSSTDNSVTVTPAYDDRDPGSITAVFSNGVSVEKPLWVGRPSIPNADITGPSEVLTGALVTYNGGISEGADSYEWWLPGNFEVVSTIDYFADNWQIASYETDWNVNVFTGYGEYGGLVQQMGRNVCGLGGARTKSVAHINQGEGPGPGDGGPGNDLPDAPDGGIPFSPDQGELSANYEFGTTNDPIPDVSIFPNPAQTEVTLNLENIASTFDTEKAVIEKVELFDALMKLQMSTEIENGVEQLQLNIAQLPSGVYKVAIHTNKGILLKQLVVSSK